MSSILSVLLVAAGLFYTNDQNRKQQELAERGQVTDRFTKAIDQLGSDKLDVRLGGIYAMERLMRDSPRDQRNIVEVLSAYIREHAGKPKFRKGASPDDRPEWASEGTPATDVQGALTVLGRRSADDGNQEIDLRFTNLAGADLRHANLSNVKLFLTDLRSARLEGANLTGADIYDSNLAHASLEGANLTDVNLEATEVPYTAFRGANLTNVRISAVDLRDAMGLTPEQMRCVLIDDRTRLPPQLGLSPSPFTGTGNRACPGR
ncbi:pentapeptide repeat-containing protein [Micromonospora chersina]|uniref:pentapeptide repeat-containing protein n=1 Tax=Micromonospora chersina TaxID=47854 RepID=UPI0033A6696D